MKLTYLGLTLALAAMSILPSTLPAHAALPTPTPAASPPPNPELESTEAVTKFTATDQLSRDGALDVLERFTYDFANAQPHPVTHKIPLGYTDDQGNLLSAKFQFLSAQLNGSTLHLNPKVNAALAQFDLPAGSTAGLRHYALHYRLRPVVLAGDDGDVFKISATGIGWPVPIASAVITLRTPGLNPQNLTCTTGAGGATTSSCRISPTKATTVISTDAVLLPGDSLSLYSGFAHHSFTKYYNSTNPLPWLLAALILVIVITLIVILLVHRRKKASS
jgi:hypothetical protein